MMNLLKRLWQEEEGQDLDDPDGTQLEWRVGELVDEPAARDLVHPEAHGAGGLAEPQVAELAVLEGLERFDAGDAGPTTRERLRAGLRARGSVGA